MALRDIYAEVQPDEDPYHLAARLGYSCQELEEVDLFETARDLWHSERGDLMLTFIGGWLKAHDGTEDDRREVVTLAVHVARLGTPYVAAEDIAVFEAALAEAEAWVAGTVEKASVATKRDAVKALIDARDEDDDYAEPLFGAYYAAMFVERFYVVYKGEENTYADAADLIREEQPPPEGSVWQTF